MKNTGKEYERFVANLQQTLLNADGVAKQKNIAVEVNKKILDNGGNEREFDIYWEYELGGLTYKTVIECKDFNSSIPIGKIDELIGKIKDIPDLKAVFATKKSYQSGAITKAEQNKIDLLIVREQEDSDWFDADGAPLIKTVHINLHTRTPTLLRKFEPILDSDWAKENVDPSQSLSLSGSTDEIFIDDIEKGQNYSLSELVNDLTPLGGIDSGLFDKVEKFNNAYICHKATRLKIASYKVEYFVYQTIVAPIIIDFSDELVGVVEYLQKGTSKHIFKNGLIK